MKILKSEAALSVVGPCDLQLIRSLTGLLTSNTGKRAPAHHVGAAGIFSGNWKGLVAVSAREPPWLCLPAGTEIIFEFHVERSLG